MHFGLKTLQTRSLEKVENSDKHVDFLLQRLELTFLENLEPSIKISSLVNAH